MKGKAVNIIQSFCILLFVLLSKTVYFGIIYENVTFIVLSIASIIFLIMNKTLLKENICIISLFYFLFITLFLMHYENIYKVEILLFFGKRAVNLLLACILVSNTTKLEFKKKYINIISIISIISLVFKIIQLLFPNYIISISNYIALPQRYIYTFFCTFGRSLGLEIRNYGPFWEPGGFQIFIVIAILCLLSDEFINKEKKLLLMFITMVSTGSTTGYIVTLVIFCGYFDYLKKTFMYKKHFFIIGLIFLLVIYVVFSGNITEKLTYVTDNGSLRDRIIDLQYGIELVKNHCIIGYGSSNIARLEVHNIYYSNSNGILALMFTFGIPFTIIYYYYLIKGLINLLNARKKRHIIAVIISIFLIHFTEEAFVLAIMFCFLFEFRKEEELL